MQYTNPKELAEMVRPAEKGMSDKYSWRLHQHLLKAHPSQLQVWISAWNGFDGHNTEDIQNWKSNKTMPRAGVLMLGLMDCDYEGQGNWFHGKSLNQICTPGREKHGWAFGPGHHTQEWVQITDWFWKQYIDKGRCTFFPHEHHWLNINANSRKCAHCLQHQNRQIHTERIKKRTEIWSPQTAH